jgi:hypothetical protein
VVHVKTGKVEPLDVFMFQHRRKVKEPTYGNVAEWHRLYTKALHTMPPGVKPPVDHEARANDLQARLTEAIQYAIKYGGIDGDHHKAWVIDQMVRAMTGCPKVKGLGQDADGNSYAYEEQGESTEYRVLVAAACDGEDGPETYEWNTGCAP